MNQWGESFYCLLALKLDMTYTISDCRGSFLYCSRFMYHRWIHFACILIPPFLCADMETAPSSTKSEWATTTPSSPKSTKRSTLLIRSSSTQAITPTAMITTWPWCACRRGLWATRPGSACRSAVMFFPPVCPWRGRGCSNRPATVTSPAGVTQVRALEIKKVCILV